jgi:hypothetical protein
MGTHEEKEMTVYSMSSCESIRQLVFVFLCNDARNFERRLVFWSEAFADSFILLLETIVNHRCLFRFFLKNLIN